MDLETLLSYNWLLMTPEFIILGSTAILTLIDLFMPSKKSRQILGWLALAGILGALASLLALLGSGTESILSDTFRLDSFAKAFKLLLLIGSAFVMLLALGYRGKEGLEEYRGEFYYLFLTALLGAMMMSSSGDLITLFTGLELLSISSYILAGMQKRNLQSNESAMKYVINGGISTAITLFGMSYLYGIAGTTNLKKIGLALSSITESQYLYLVGLAFFMILTGLAFKIASVPFHMWAPDVYQGSPLPVTAFLSVVSKTAGFVLIARVVLVIALSAPSEGPGSLPLIIKVQDYMAFLAGATMIAGNVIALRQRNIKRLFAYSSIAHAGYIFVAISAASVFMFDSLWFYLGAYLLMSLGAFAVIQAVSEKAGSEDISIFSGLYKRSPLLAAAMGIFILSLAGIPGTAGFIGKLNIITGALMTEPAHYVLVSIMVAATVVSYYYYFGILTQMFFRPAADQEKPAQPASVSIVIGVCACAVIVFGILPNLAIDFLQSNFNQFADFLQ